MLLVLFGTISPFRCLISVACCIAVETSDTKVCCVALKRAIQKWTHILDCGSIVDEDKVIEDLMAVFRVLQSKVLK